MASLLGCAVGTGLFENTGGEPLVGLRYFGPNVHPSTPQIGDHRKP